MATDDQHNLRDYIRQTLSLLGWGRTSTCNDCMPQAVVRCATKRCGATATRSPAGHDAVETASA
jgi:hypothetical protein